MSHLWKKATSVATALLMVLSLVPGSLPLTVQAAGLLNVNYDFSALPAGHGLTSNQFNHNILDGTGANVGNASGDGSIGVADGSYTLEVTGVPGGYAVGNNPHPIPFTINNADANVTIQIVQNAGAGGGGAQAQAGTLTTTYDFSALPNGHGLTSNQFNHNILDSNGANVGNASGDGSIGVQTGSYTLEVTGVPAGYAVVNNPNPIPFTVTANTDTPVTIQIVLNGGAGGGGAQAQAGTLTTTYDFSALPNGHGLTSNQFNHNILDSNGAIVGNASGDGSIGVQTGNYTLQITGVPAGFAVGNNPNPIPFTVTANTDTPVTIQIVQSGGGGGGGGGNQAGTLTTTYDFSALPNGHGLTSNQFNHNILDGNGTVVGNASGDGTIGVQTGSYTLQITGVPAGFAVGNNPNPIPFIITANTDTPLTINIVSTGASAQFNVSPTSGLTTSEIGTSTTFTVALASNPSADVTINLSSSDTTEGTVSPASLTFTDQNGTVPQTVTITGQDDTIVDGNIGYTIVLAPAVSTDNNFNGQDPADVSVVNNDDDTNGGNPGGGGGGGRRRSTAPVISFIRDNQVITSLTLAVGEDSDVTVTAVDNRGFSIDLTFSTDPTANLNNTATFTVTDNNTGTPSGSLDWTPTADNLGQFDFVFNASNGQFDTQAILPITVSNTVAPGATGGGGGGGGGNRPIEERVADCEYSDNNTESVVYLCLLGIIDPPNNEEDFYGNNKNRRYFPRSKMNRAEFTKIMVNIAYGSETLQRINELVVKNDFFAFPDVSPETWYAKFITVGKLDDHLHGYPESGEFVPWRPIIAAEAMKILFNTARHDNEKIKDDLEIIEEELGEDQVWYTKFAALAYAYGGYTPDLTKNDPGIIYSKILTRQEAADIIYTTIQNAGIDPKSHVSNLKINLIEVQDEIKEAELELDLDPVSSPDPIEEQDLIDEAEGKTEEQEEVNA